MVRISINTLRKMSKKGRYYRRRLQHCHQQAFNFKNSKSLGLRPKLGGLLYHNNIVGTLNIHLCPSHIGQVLRLPGAVSPDMLHNASLRITLTIPEMAGTEN